MKKEVIIGIDLGTTNSAVGVVDSGFPILLADRDGERLLPSAVWYGEENQIEVGRAAKHRRALGGVITSVKRLMGTSRKAAGGFSAEEVSAEILKSLKLTAEMRLECPIHKAVITVPAYFNEAQRGATKRAGELAGLEVVRLLSEPTAAALAYGLDKLDEEQKIAVYDLGGGTFDVSILELRAGQLEVLATAGDTCLGGDDFDQALIAHLGLDLSAFTPSEQSQVLAESERVKIALSKNETVIFRVPFLSTGPFEQKVTRKVFEGLIEPFLKKAESCCRRALNDCGLVAADLQGVVLAGGSTHSPIVKQSVECIFGRAAEEGVDPDEAVGLGAAIQAGILSGAVRNVVLLDVTPLSLGIETMGGLMNVIIPRNTTIPCKAGELFTNALTGQRQMRVRVLQGEHELGRDNWELGRVEVPFEPTTKGKARVGVQFSLDANGLLEVLARDTFTGQDVVLQIESAAVDVSDDTVEQMVSESVEHAFSDMKARIYTEAKLKAEELLNAVGPALEMVQGTLSHDEIESIRIAEKAVRDELNREEDDGPTLKSVVEKLDLQTEKIATLVIELATY